MYLIAIAWVYVALMAALADTTVIGGILTFVFYGLAPLALFLWIFGTPARRRARIEAERHEEAGTNDRAESGPDQ